MKDRYNRNHPSKYEIHNPIYINGEKQRRKYNKEITKWAVKRKILFDSVYGMVNIVEWMEKEKERINAKPGKKVDIITDFAGEICLCYI